jgi:hypothetical protein
VTVVVAAVTRRGSMTGGIGDTVADSSEGRGASVAGIAVPQTLDVGRSRGAGSGCSCNN